MICRRILCFELWSRSVTFGKHPKPTRRRALDLLASCPDGCFEGLLVAHGFSIPFIVRLVHAGLATVHTERPSRVGYIKAARRGLASALVFVTILFALSGVP
jgi:hypothetical protein